MTRGLFSYLPCCTGPKCEGRCSPRHFERRCQHRKTADAPNVGQNRSGTPFNSVKSGDRDIHKQSETGLKGERVTRMQDCASQRELGRLGGQIMKDCVGEKKKDESPEKEKTNK